MRCREDTFRFLSKHSLCRIEFAIINSDRFSSCRWTRNEHRRNVASIKNGVFGPIRSLNQFLTNCCPSIEHHPLSSFILTDGLESAKVRVASDAHLTDFDNTRTEENFLPRGMSSFSEKGTMISVHYLKHDEIYTFLYRLLFDLRSNLRPRRTILSLSVNHLQIIPRNFSFSLDFHFHFTLSLIKLTSCNCAELISVIFV